MILFLLISVGLGCTIKNQHLQNLYPTEQEHYKLDMSELFDGEDLFYICTIGSIDIRSRNIQRCNLKDDGIEMKNVITEEKFTAINFTKITKIINSVSGYQNYISTIQDYSNITTYEVDYDSNTITELYKSKIQVNIDCKSFSSTFTQSSNIITDCFNETNFQLLLFVQNVPIIIYQKNNLEPETSFISYTNLVYYNNYIIHAIYYNNNISYLHTYKYDETTQKAKFLSRYFDSYFTDFSLMADGNSIAVLNLTNCIFISQLKDLNNVNQINFPSVFNNSQFLALKSFPSFYYGQLLTSFIIVTDNYFESIFEVQFNGSNFQNLQVYESLNSYTFNRSFPITIYLSTSFLIVQQYDYQTYFYLGKYTNSIERQQINQIYQNRNFEKSEQFYLNYDNKILKFSQRISWHHLSLPRLIIQITTQNQSGLINIYAYENPDVHNDIDIIGCNVNLTYQLLSQNNNSILNTTDLMQLQTIQDLSETFRINDHFTGPLLQLNLDDQQNDTNFTNDPNISISTPQSKVFQYLSNTLPGLMQNQTQVYFIENYELLLYAWTLSNNLTNIFYSICKVGDQILNCSTSQQSISCNVSQLTTIQMTQLNDTELVLAFDQGPQNIQIYSISLNSSKIKSIDTNNNELKILQNFTFDYSIQQFQILYNKLIVLNNQSEIIVYIYNFNTSYYINQSTINQVGGQQYNIEFQPIQIQVNQQLFQSTLFINNQNSFILLELFNQSKQNNNFKILSQQQVTQNIYQIVVSQMYIVLASITDIGQSIVSFSVYDISDITKPTFSKPLPNCTILSGSQILADNYFFYVRQINYTIMIYSIDLPYHSSLYFNLKLNQEESLSCTNTKQFSILSFQNNLFACFQNNPYSFQISQVKLQNSMLTVGNLSTNISNPWNFQIITYKLIVVNIYVQISMNYTEFVKNNNTKELTFYAKKNSNNNQVLIPLNVTDISVGQVLNYSIVAEKSESNQSNQHINIINQFVNGQQYFAQQIVNITQMVSYCGSLFYQNVSGLYQSSYVIFEGLQRINFSPYNFTECLSLSVTINGLSIFLNSICKSHQIITVMSLFPNILNSTDNKTNMTCNFTQPWNFTQNISYINDTRYSSIMKSSQLSHYLFILGKLGQNANTQQIYIYDLNQLSSQSQLVTEIRKIQCKGGISDYNFTILQNKSLINNTYSGRGVIFFLCQNPSQLKYVSFNITNSTNLTFSKVSNKVSDVITQYIDRSDSKFLQIFIYLVKYDQIILVLTSNNVYNLVIIMSYSPLSYAETSLQFEDVIAYIPPYGTYTQIPIGVLQDSYLALLFRSTSTQGVQNIVAMYNISKVRQTYNLSTEFSYNSTIQMDGGYQFNKNLTNIHQIALINQTTDQIYNQGQYLLVLSSEGENLDNTSLTLLVYNQSIYFSCDDVGELSDYQQFYLIAQNSFYNQSMPININRKSLSSPIWAWILLILTIIICGILVSQFWTKLKTQNLENKTTELLEIEM